MDVLHEAFFALVQILPDVVFSLVRWARTRNAGAVRLPRVLAACQPAEATSQTAGTAESELTG